MQQFLGSVSSLGSVPSFKDLLGIQGEGNSASSVASPVPTNVVSAPEGYDAEAPPDNSAEHFPVGTIVEYNSASQGAWIPAKVLAWNADGTCDLDCKPRISPLKIRALPPVAPQEYEVRAVVEYYSESRQGWIPARVVEYNPVNGTYDLDCKPNVHPSKLRPHPTSRPSSSGRRSTDARNRFDPIQERGESAGSEEEEPDSGTDAGGRPLGTTASSLYDEQSGGASGSSSIAGSSATSALGSQGQLSALGSQGQLGAPGAQSDERGSAGIAARKSKGTPAVPMHSSGSLAESRQAGTTGSLPRSPPRLLPPIPQAHRGEVLKPQEEPLQLVRVGKQNGAWHFEVDEAAAAVLEGYGQRHVAVCTVCGPYRTGKSYLLNLLLGRIQQGKSQFKVGSTTRACTEGLWMWGAGDASGDGSSIIFMDCEGFGSTDADKTRDAKLMALCILISSVFLLNTKGVLNEGLFNALALVCNLAEHIEERGQEASKPTLLWLLRDFVLELQDESGRALSPDEYLEKSLRAQPLAGPSRERSQAAFEVRECLMRYFPDRHCSTLVQPVIEEEQLRRLSELPYDQLRPEFRGVFEATQARLLNVAKASPKTLGGRPLGAASLAGLLRKLVDALNREQALNVSSAWDQVQHTACAGLSDELRRGAMSQIQRLKEGGPLPGPGGQPLPVRDDLLARATKEARKALREEWRTRAVGDEPVKARYWRELKEGLQGEEKALEQLNAQLGERQVGVAESDWEAWLSQEGEATASDPRSEALALLLDKGLPYVPSARAARDALNAARMARIRWDGSTRALRAELKLVSDDLASKAAAAEAASKVDDAQLEQEREVGRLRGQVEALQNQARDAIKRDKALREEAVEAEERARKEERMKAEAERKRDELERTVQDLESQVADLKEELREASLVKEASAGGRGPRRDGKPKCGCSVM